MPDRKKKPANQRAVLRRVLAYIRPHMPLVALSLLLSLVSVALTLYVPILVGRAIDCIVGPGQVRFDALVPILKTIAVCVLVTAGAQWLQNELNNRVTYNTVRDIRRDAFAHIQTLPLKYLDAHPTGDIVSRMISDVDTFADGLLMGFTQLFTGVMTILGTLIFMLTLSAPITLVVVLITPLSLFVANFIARRTYDMFRLQTKTRGEQTALIDEAIGEQKLVQAFGHGAQTLSEFDEVNERLRQCSLRATFFSSLTNPCTRFVNAIVYAGVGLTGALAAVSGSLTVGGLSSFLSYANQYTKPFNEISGVITELQNALACAGRIFELIDEPSQTPDPKPAKALGEVRGEVALDHVCFSYTPERRLIEDFTLRVRPGQRVAIVGPTGCGKTTLINLLMRFYDVNSGEIRVDGIETREVTRGALRQNIGMVLQDTWLSSGTIRDNIAMGRPDASFEEIVEAAKAAHAHSFIRRLPDGYSTVISESGGQLSQGQKQLLCIARVMLCLPPMLILDEATSSIDTRTELRIQSAFAQMMQGRTSFIVAHRLSTIQSADVILVMRDGHVVEQGTHEELLARGGFYHQLYQSQFAQ
ncbi:MAG: ABC transporter ATP-binding protein [Clostridiales bacterium]|nr:ABC transporter ATP-binding protein [Clostridiales bacterium]MDY5515171.1 ABC transporter ATP-binding protein [Candidatus Ventricola sp.]